jgi:hypothetical protein
VWAPGNAEKAVGPSGVGDGALQDELCTALEEVAAKYDEAAALNVWRALRPDAMEAWVAWGWTPGRPAYAVRSNVDPCHCSCRWKMR